MAVGRPPTSVIGRYSIEPAAALVTVGVMWTARWRGQHDARDARALGRAEERAEVAGVGHPVDGEQERVHPVADAGQHVVELHLGQRRRPGEHALGRLGAGRRRELGAAHVAHRHPDALGQLGDVVEHQRVVLVAGHPDLADLAGAGQQQLTHRLAALDLVTAEALRARWTSRDRLGARTKPNATDCRVGRPCAPRPRHAGPGGWRRPSRPRTNARRGQKPWSRFPRRDPDFGRDRDEALAGAPRLGGPLGRAPCAHDASTSATA